MRGEVRHFWSVLFVSAQQQLFQHFMSGQILTRRGQLSTELEHDSMRLHAILHVLCLNLDQEGCFRPESDNHKRWYHVCLGI